MRNYDVSVSSASWALVYDSAELGDFDGYAQVTNSTEILLRIGTELPAATDSGALVGGFPRQVTVKASGSENIYARTRGNSGMLSLMTVSDMQLPISLGQKTAAGSISTIPASDAVHIVAGQSAVGSVPANPPVGVSGVDGSGLKRALLTDTTGKLNVISPDCLDVSGSVSSADVLFSVDMLNYQSITVNITSAGSSCTIIWEESADNSTNWIPVSASNVAPTPASNSFSTTTGVTGGFIIAKRLRYFRARVSIYGSGTVTVVGNLLSGHNTISTLALCVGTSTEGAAVSGIPITIAAEARTSSKTSVANGQTVRPIATVEGRLVIRPHSIPENEWAYAAASGGILNVTTEAQVKGGVASLRNYMTTIQLQAEPLTNATEFVIRDGAGGNTLWRIKIPTTGLPLTNFKFDDPLRTTAATGFHIQTVTASGAGAVYFNAQGYVAP